MQQPQPTLYLVPTPLDFGTEHQGSLGDCLPEASLLAASRLSHWICENAKSLRAFLKRVDLTHPLCCSLQMMQITELPRQAHKQGDHAGAAAFDARPWLEPAKQGFSIGLASEAGMPAIADPGSSVVRAAHAIGLPVAPLVGPVSLMLALAASGLNGQNFAFVGYLPQDQNERAKQIKALQSHVLQSRQTQIFIETPYRNAALLNALLQHLSGNIRLSVSSGLTMKKMSNRCMSVSEWKQSGQTAPDKDTPAVYMIGV